MAKVADLYAEIRGDTSKLKGALNDAKGQLTSFGNEAKGALGGLDFTSAAIGLAKVAAVAMAAKKVFDFGAEGAQLERVRVSTTMLAKSFGSNMGDIVRSIRTASMNTIPEFSAIQSAGRAMMLGLGADASQLGNLMEIAAFRGRIMGVDATKAFDDIVTGIGRKSRLILDNLGIIIDAEQAYKDYAATIGVSVGELDAAGKVQAYLNAVLTEGNALMAANGGLTFDSATAYERLGAKIKDVINAVKEDVSFNVLKFIATPEEVETVAAANKEVAQLTGNFGKWMDALAFSNNWQPWEWKPTEDYLAYANRMEKEWMLIQRYQGYESRPAAPESAVEPTREFNHELALQVGLSRDVSNAIDQQASSINDLIFEYANMGDIEIAAEAQLRIARSLDLVDEKSIALQESLRLVKEAADMNKNGFVDLGYESTYLNSSLQILSQNAATLLTDKEATWTINVVMRGMGGVGFTQTGNVDAILSRAFLKQHGGEVVGLQHGGVVPPGFANDGFPMFVSSGERVSVEPAGNKNIENMALLTKLDELNYKLDGIPRAIKEAVQMIV